uniref:Transposase, Ptta/En/Spm, plant n=1 Tax=Chenopodium quinoa TaxID=63459 RepID=A0A803NAG6_CHEQI
MSIIPTSSEQDQQENEIQQPPPRYLKDVSKRATNLEEKITFTFMDELQRVVGEKTNEFICDCSNRVEEFCPLNALNWAKMDLDAKKSLYDKILAKYNLPEKIGGADATDALIFQCSILYRYWRFRLKEKYYRGKTKAEARDYRPSTIDPIQWDWLVYEYWSSPKQEAIRKVNTANKLKLTKTPDNGAKSKARIFYDMINEPPIVATQVKEHGEDTLSVKDAYMKVLKPKSGYVRGLRPGVRPPTKVRTQGDDMDRVQLSTQVHTLSASNEELRASNEQLKASNEELKASIEELKAEFSRMNMEAIDRENKLREDMLKCLRK